MKTASLILITKDNSILLGYKKRKDAEVGSETYNGPGGKLIEGESIVECAVRETREEIGIELSPDTLEEIAVITFFAAGVADFKVHVFATSQFTGEPIETEEMVPRWFELSAVPYDRMMDSDRAWFPRALSGEKFRANVHYAERGKGFRGVDLLPY